MRHFALLALFATCLGAQNELVSRVFELKHARPSRVRQMLLGAHEITHDDGLKTLAVRATKEKMDEFEKTIERLDAPAPPVPNVEVTIYLMSALGQPAATPIPPEMEGVVKQLRSTFSYKGYQLLDTQLIRVRAGEQGQATGVIGAPAGGPNTITDISFRSAAVSNEEKGRTVRISNLKVGLRVPNITNVHPSGEKQFQYIQTGFSTDVDVREGQKVVVGKANMDGSDRASIVVVMARVVD